MPELIKPPRYFAGRTAVYGPWKKIKPGRMCYTVGYRWYREGITDHRHFTYDFK